MSTSIGGGQGSRWMTKAPLYGFFDLVDSCQHFFIHHNFAISRVSLEWLSLSSTKAFSSKSHAGCCKQKPPQNISIKANALLMLLSFMIYWLIFSVMRRYRTRVTDWVSNTVEPSWLMWTWWVKIPTEDFTDETLAVDDTLGDDVRGGDLGDGHGG